MDEIFDFKACHNEIKQSFCMLEKKLLNRLLILVDIEHKNDKEMLEIQVLSRVVSSLSFKLNIQTDER